MASTYSTSLRLELMATGDQSGTWGDTTNTNLGTLLEQAITGVLSVAQGDVANLTLTNLNGASDQARNAVVNLTGAMTAARNVVVPAPNKLYLIKNSTTGGFAVTVKTPSGTGVTVPAGTARWVYADGTNVVDGISGPLSPSANDAQALGFSGTAWADLFLASGGVINWNAGNVTLTQSANALAFAGVTSGISMDGALSLSTTAAGTLQTLTSTDAGAAAGPVLDLYRNSASPAANDILGQVIFNGKDSAANKQEYASIEAVIADPTSTSEDSALNMYVQVGGVRTLALSLTGADITPANILAYRNWRADAIGVNNYNCVISADEVTLKNSSNGYITQRSVSKTVNANGSVGAPLSIMSARAASTWYYMWLWYNVANGLTATLDASSSAPTAPTGYSSSDYQARMPGAMRTDASGSTYLVQLSTRDSDTDYRVLTGSNTANLPSIGTTGAQGSPTTPTWFGLSTTDVVPPTAVRIRGHGGFVGGISAAYILAPSDQYGSVSSGTNPPPLQFNTTNTSAGGSFDFELESTSIYYACGTAGGYAVCKGWRDNL